MNTTKEPCDFPTGTITLVHTDIEGSSQMSIRYGKAFEAARAEHYRLLREACLRWNGYEVDTAGDALFLAFALATDAVQWAVEAQRALAAHSWPAPVEKVCVRIGMHTGEPHIGEDQGRPTYRGPATNKAARIQGAGHGGQVLLSDATYSLVQGMLPPEIGFHDCGRHRLKDVGEERIWQVKHADLPFEFPPLKSLDSARHNLPLPLTSFIGREHDIAAASQLLQRDDVRILTLHGPGGTGKTRLSIEIAGHLLSEFQDGCYFVPLAPLTDPNLMLAAVATAVGIAKTPDRPLIETLQYCLDRKQMLLVLDNFEHIVEAAPEVHRLLTACPRLKILISSRMKLDISGEHGYGVSPLALPHRAGTPSPESLMESPAVQLFVQRAQAAKSEFMLTAENAESITYICVRLDGLPLAIELAAARISLLTPAALIARLDNSLKLLTSGARDMPGRQRTLRAAIAWSYDLLEEKEKTLFRRLAVFSGGWTLEAAAAIGGESDYDELDVMDALGSLVNKSLVLQASDSGDEPRFGMLETIREFAVETLRQSGEYDDISRRHGEFFLTLCEETEKKQAWKQVSIWQRKLAADHDNLRRAVAWSIDHDPILALRIITAANRLWLPRRYPEWLDWLETVLANAEDTPDSLRATGLLYLGLVTIFTPGSHERLLHSRELYRQCGDEVGAAWASTFLAQYLNLNGDPIAARELLLESQLVFEKAGDLRGIGSVNLRAAATTSNFQEYYPPQVRALAAFRELDDKLDMLDALCAITDGMSQNDRNAEAKSYAQEAIDLARETGTPNVLCYAYAQMANCHLALGETAEAMNCCRQSGEIARGVEQRDYLFMFILRFIAETQVLLDDYKGAIHLAEEALLRYRISKPKGFEIVAILKTLGTAYLGMGELSQARQHLSEALELVQELPKFGQRSWLEPKIQYYLGHVAIKAGEYELSRSFYRQTMEGTSGHPHGHLSNLEALGNLARVQGYHWRAARLLGAAEMLAEEFPEAERPFWHKEIAPKVPELRGSMGEEAFVQAWEEGRAMSMEEAVRYALETE